MSKTAFLFPGQGAQKTGMGQDFYEKFPSAREIFDQASQWLSLDMKALCFEKNDRLNLTEYTQAALVTTCLAMEKVVEEYGLCPDVTAGLSLGEYCAIAVSGGMSVQDAITTVRKRGILMEQAVPAGEGSMAAVMGLDADKIQAVLGGMKAEIANYNCPGQIVITGPKAAVEEASVKLKEAGSSSYSKWTVSFIHASECRKRTGKRAVKSGIFQSENPLCNQCNGTVCDRFQGDKRPSRKADFFLGPLAAKRGKDAGRWRGYLCGEWSWKDFNWFYEENCTRCKDL